MDLSITGGDDVPRLTLLVHSRPTFDLGKLILCHARISLGFHLTTSSNSNDKSKTTDLFFFRRIIGASDEDKETENLAKKYLTV